MYSCTDAQLVIQSRLVQTCTQACFSLPRPAAHSCTLHRTLLHSAVTPGVGWGQWTDRINNQQAGSGYPWKNCQKSNGHLRFPPPPWVAHASRLDQKPFGMPSMINACACTWNSIPFSRKAVLFIQSYAVMLNKACMCIKSGHGYLIKGIIKFPKVIHLHQK